MLVKQKVIGIFEKCKRHVYITRKCIWGHLQGIAILSVFNFGCKNGRVTTATCKYCLLAISPSDEALCKFLLLPTVAKNFILNVVEFLDPPLKTSPCRKTNTVSCETNLFTYHFTVWPPWSKFIMFFSVTFYWVAF